MVDLCFVPERPATVATVNDAMRAAAAGPLKGILAITDKPLVSSDFNHDPHSSIFATAQTSVSDGGLVRVLGWYDNEWGFSNRMLDTAGALAAVGALAVADA